MTRSTGFALLCLLGLALFFPLSLVAAPEEPPALPVNPGNEAEAPANPNPDTGEKIKIRRSGDPVGETDDLPTMPGDPSAEEKDAGVKTDSLGQARAKEKTPLMERVNFSGYFRLMGRNDFGNNSDTLGWWPLYGRLMNETPWVTLMVTNHVILPEKKQDPRASVVMRIEGGSLRGADSGLGDLENYRFTQLYLETENAGWRSLTLQAGTLWYNMGYIGIYDMYVSQVFWETVGIRGGQRVNDKLEYFIGIGDSGYNFYEWRRETEPDFQKSGYNAVPTVGGLFKVNLADLKLARPAFPFTNQFWLGLGGQFHFEEENERNPNAAFQTPGITYEELARGEVLENYLRDNPGRADWFPRPEARPARYFKLTAWLGFNFKKAWGPVHLKWNDTSFSLVRKRPEGPVTEEFDGVTKKIYIRDLTDQRYETYLVNESQWQIIPRWLDMNIGLLYGEAWDKDNQIRPDDHSRRIFSVVARPQVYFTRELHALVEISLAREYSKNGNRYREHFDSIEASSGGFGDDRGLEWGDSDVKNTLQMKFGPVFNPNGRGINNRPSIRMLFGAQYSNVHAAFGNTFNESLEQRNFFNYGRDAHWHYMISLEAEHWWGSY